MATTIKILKIKMVRCIYILILGGAPHLRIGVCVCACVGFNIQLSSCGIRTIMDIT